MIQHPLPQNVTSYQFRLIGDMTIKQFVLLSIGVGSAIFFYYTNLFSPIKWLFVISSGMAGFAIAFMPYEDRPLDQWIINYIRAIYKPTRFIWRKESKAPSFFAFTGTGANQPTDAQELARTAAIRKQQGLRSFLITLPQDQNDSMDAQETSSVTNVLGLFGQSGITPLDPTAAPTTSLNISPAINSTIPTIIAPVIQQASPPVTSAQGGVIKSAPIQINKSESINVEEKIAAPITIAQPNSTTLTSNDTAGPVVAATTTSKLPFPSTPTTPNTIVGMVLDSNEKIVENAIIEVADETGLTARATKTNQLGQFFSTTPLKSGVYRISIEKLGLSFDTIELNLTGRIIEPIKIQAK